MDFVNDFPTIDDDIFVSHGINWFSFPQQQTYHEIMGISLLEEDFIEFNWAPEFSYYQSNQLCFNAFPELENISFNDFDLPPLDYDSVVDQKPLSIVVPKSPQGQYCNREGSTSTNGVGFVSVKIERSMSSTTCMEQEEKQIQETASSIRKQRRSSALDFHEIKKHFGVPITEAAKEMDVGLTLLKRRCRELNIMRWPHRKLKSLKLLIDNVKEMGLAKEAAMLEQQQKMLEKLPGMELTEKAKRLRQACFKANYKRRRNLAKLQP